MATLKTISYIQKIPQKFLEVSEPSSQEGSDLPRNPPINQNLKSSNGSVNQKLTSPTDKNHPHGKICVNFSEKIRCFRLTNAPGWCIMPNAEHAFYILFCFLFFISKTRGNIKCVRNVGVSFAPIGVPITGRRGARGANESAVAPNADKLFIKQRRESPSITSSSARHA